MFASSNNHRSVTLTSASRNLQEDEIMQNDLNQSDNSRRIETIRIETNSSSDELKKNSDASKMLMSNLNERFEKAKRQLQDRLKLQKLKKFKTKIRILKREDSETVEKQRRRSS
jgi:type II secretory pathway component HofQ